MKPVEFPGDWSPIALDLSPAKWIWLPSQRTLANTFVLFRRELNVRGPLAAARGWLSADSRYLLTVNGQRVQWGPAPCDPRHADAEPLDLLPFLREGRNVIGVQVLYFGMGEGSWPCGKPGLLLNLELKYRGGAKERIVSDNSWRAAPDRAHRPGQYKRWYLRALQEDFDAREFPFGWDTPQFDTGAGAAANWLPAMELKGRADKPAVFTDYGDYLHDMQVPAAQPGSLRRRQVPLLREVIVPVKALSESGRVHWRRDPRDWFDFRTPGSFELERQPVARERGRQQWELPAAPGLREGVYALFEFEEELTGFPRFQIDAPAGAVVELIWQESHDPKNPPWLDTHFYFWARFTCREGRNEFETFDFEGLRWLQIHVRNSARPVVIENVGARRRLYDWTNRPQIQCAEKPLQRVFDACLNTIENICQGALQSDAARERQQYSADGSRPLTAIRYAYGDTLLSRRFLRTYSEGMTVHGYLFDTWPGVDRLERTGQRQFGWTMWGPLLDFSLAFIYDCWLYYQDTGDDKSLRELWPQVLRIAAFFEKQCAGARDGLLPVEELGTANVFIDHFAYPLQRQKQCAHNLFAAAVFMYALPDLARAVEKGKSAPRFAKFGARLHAAAVRSFWDRKAQLFVNNRPWLREEKKPRLCEMSLAYALLFGLCPSGRVENVLRTLADCPSNMGRVFAANCNWRLSALAKYGRMDLVLTELRGDWTRLPSVVHNNTLSEMIEIKPDSTDQWCHNAIIPLFVLFQDIAGITPLEPGFARVQIRPQLGDLGALSLTAHTPHGPIRFNAESLLGGGGHRVSVELPRGCEGELVLNGHPGGDFKVLRPDHPLGMKRFVLAAGKRHSFIVKNK